MRLVLVTFALLSLAACATKPPPKLAACIDFGHSDSIYNAMPRLYSQPKVAQDLVTARTPDGHAGLVVDVDVWLGSEPQERPALHKARFVLDACSMELKSAAKVSG